MKHHYRLINKIKYMKGKIGLFNDIKKITKNVEFFSNEIKVKKLNL